MGYRIPDTGGHGAGRRVIAWRFCALCYQFPAMITDWRNGFNDSGLPFYYVELDSPETPWIREAQRAALKLPHTGFVSSADIGCAPSTQIVPKCFGVHSHRKSEVGRRLSLHLLADLFHRGDVVTSGPQPVMFTGSESPSATVTVTYGPATSGGLHLNGTADCGFANDTDQSRGTTGPCCTISPFVFRAIDGSWVRSPQPPTVRGNKVIVPIPAGGPFADLSYNFEAYPPCALYSVLGSGPDSHTGLPAAPFRQALLSGSPGCPASAVLCPGVPGAATNPDLQQTQCCTNAGNGIEVCFPGMGCWGKYETVPVYGPSP